MSAPLFPHRPDDRIDRPAPREAFVTDLRAQLLALHAEKQEMHGSIGAWKWWLLVPAFAMFAGIAVISLRDNDLTADQFLQQAEASATYTVKENEITYTKERRYWHSEPVEGVAPMAGSASLPENVPMLWEFWITKIDGRWHQMSRRSLVDGTTLYHVYQIFRKDDDVMIYPEEHFIWVPEDRRAVTPLCVHYELSQEEYDVMFKDIDEEDIFTESGSQLTTYNAEADLTFELQSDKSYERIHALRELLKRGTVWEVVTENTDASQRVFRSNITSNTIDADGNKKDDVVVGYYLYTFDLHDYRLLSQEWYDIYPDGHTNLQERIDYLERQIFPQTDMATIFDTTRLQLTPLQSLLSVRIDAIERGDAKQGCYIGKKWTGADVISLFDISEDAWLNALIFQFPRTLSAPGVTPRTYEQ